MSEVLGMFEDQHSPEAQPYAAPIHDTDTTGRSEREERKRRPAYVRQIHVELVVALVVVCVALGAYGWSLRPQSSGFPTVPENMSLAVTGQGVNAVTETLSRKADGGARLEILDNGSSPTTGNWQVSIGNLGSGRVCTPRDDVTFDQLGQTSIAKLEPQHIMHPPAASVGGPPVVYTNVQSSGFLYVVLCWSSDAPVTLRGAYLSAQFPQWFPDNSDPTAPTISLTQTLIPNSEETANYVLESRTPPVSSTPDSWQWSPVTDASGPLRVSAVNTNGTQHDSYRAFLSGIAFGIAGGALITLIQELVVPFTRRRDARNPV